LVERGTLEERIGYSGPQGTREQGVVKYPYCNFQQIKVKVLPIELKDWLLFGIFQK